MAGMNLQEKDIKYLVANLNRLIGVLESAKRDIQENHACEETVSKIHAAKGAAARVGIELINRGVLSCLQDYSKEELEEAIKSMFKLE